MAQQTPPKATVKWTLDYSYTQIVGSKPLTVTIPTFGEKDVDVAAGDMITVVVPKGQTVAVDLQPTKDAGPIHSILMMNTPIPDKNPPPSGNGAGDASSTPSQQYLTYSVNGGTDQIPLDQFQVLIGYGVFRLLKDVPTTISFTNPLDADASVSIVIGRNLPSATSASSQGSGASSASTSTTSGGSSLHPSDARADRPGSGVHDQGAGSHGHS